MVPQQMTSMRLCLVLPLHCSEIDNIWLGDALMIDTMLESDHHVPVWIEDGQVRICILPTAMTRYHNGKPVMRLRKQGQFMLIDLINYQGPPRSLPFQKHALANTRNGFVCEMVSIDSDADMDAFRARISAGKLTDHWQGEMRHVHYVRDHVDLRIEQDPYQWETIPPAWIAGQSRITPKLYCKSLENQKVEQVK